MSAKIDPATPNGDLAKARLAADQAVHATTQQRAYFHFAMMLWYLST